MLLVAVVADGFGRATCNALLAERNLLGSCWLTKDIRMSLLVIAPDVVRCGRSAEIAIGALVVDVILASTLR